jgi:hypothetical protein
MKSRKIVVTSLIVLVSFTGVSQIVGAGIQPKLTVSRQINVVQEIPKEFARSVESFLSAPGCELFADYSLSTSWRLRLKAGVETRGYVSQYPGISVDQRAQKFKHISTSLSALYYFRKDAPIRPYLLAGVHSGYLYQSEVIEELIKIEGTYYTPANINHSDYAHINLSGTGGLGIDFHDKLWLEFSYNRDLIAPLQNAELKAFNSMYSFNVGINLLNWFKK